MADAYTGTLSLFSNEIDELDGRAPLQKLSTFSLSNRRFLGSKQKLLSFIKSIVDEEVGEYKSFADLFAGTGVVGDYFNTPSVKIITNDLLFSNFVALEAFLGVRKLDVEEIKKKIVHLNSLEPTDNYFSATFGGRYFSLPNAQLIGSIREEIDLIASNQDEKYALLTSLIYAADKVANTVGHYDAYRETLTENKRLKLKVPSIRPKNNKKNEIYNEDANKLAESVYADVVYLDPPYNSRQYSDTYHVLENLAIWEKPEVFGKAKKMDRKSKKSEYSLKSATEAFSELVVNLNCKHILLSYNNTGSKKDGRSNARISDEDIVKILSDKGRLKIYEQAHKAFTTGKSETNGHIERVFYCEVSS